MTLPTRTIEPTHIAIGERVEWTRTFADYSAQDYDLQYRFRGPGPGFDVDATADGSAFVAEITAAQSALMVAGQYRYQAWLTEQATPTNTFPLRSAAGRITVEAGFEEGETGDIETRTPAKIMLDCIDAALLAFASSDVLEYEIETPAGRRRIKRSDKSQLMSDRKYWAGIVTNEIAREGARQGRPLMQNIQIRVHDE